MSIVKERSAGLLTVVISLIVLTPICGLLFSCGCTWPGAGLEANCNYFDPNSHHQCPWCASMIAGGLSLGAALLAGYYASMGNGYVLKLSASPFYRLLLRIISGLMVFFLVAFITGLISAKLQGYPFFFLDI